MIRNRLSELLSERGLKISRVAKEVDIARSSLTSMVQNDSEMVRYDAIDKLCTFLNVTPQDFFEHIPLNFEFNFDEEPRINITNEEDITFGLKKAIQINNFNFEMLVDVTDEKNEKHNFDLEVSFKEIKPVSKTNDKFLFVFQIDNEQELKDLKKYVDKLTPGLKNVLFKRIQKYLSGYISLMIKKNVEDHEAWFLTGDEKTTLHGVISQTHSLLDSEIFKEY